MESGLDEEAPDSGQQSWRPDPGELEEVGAFGVYEVSAKTGDGVQEVFVAMTEELVNRRLDERNPLRGGRGKVLARHGKEGHETVVLSQASSKQKSRCC